ncbi:MAG: hypothetical protein JOZ77_13265 [Candidatus Eremiobacteraeota bacterium]|nr:hypothetical protein [Candidatus Eremiobacteraeota bacterium]
MPAPTPPTVICTPYVGRTIKGWSVRVRVCFSVTPAESGASTFSADVETLATDMAGTMNALSDVTFVPLGGSNPVQNTVYGAAGVYADAEDSAVFSFLTSNGTVAKISIPAPKASIFLADGMTVDPSNANVSAFVGALTGGGPGGLSGFWGATKSGASYQAFLGAVRVRHRTRRKMNIFIKDPNLTIPAI